MKDKTIKNIVKDTILIFNDFEGFADFYCDLEDEEICKLEQELYDYFENILKDKKDEMSKL